jgi:hypothetical protein
MYILVNHSINMPAQFWGAAQKYLTTLPEDGVKRVVSIFPSDNMDQCTTIWEADSTESLDRYLQNKISNTGKYSYYRINEANAVGLNEVKMPFMK